MKVIQGHRFRHQSKARVNFLSVNDTNILSRIVSKLSCGIGHIFLSTGMCLSLTHCSEWTPKLTLTKFGVKHRSIVWCNILNCLGFDHECDGQTDGRANNLYPTNTTQLGGRPTHGQLCFVHKNWQKSNFFSFNSLLLTLPNAEYIELGNDRSITAATVRSSIRWHGNGCLATAAASASRQRYKDAFRQTDSGTRRQASVSRLPLAVRTLTMPSDNNG